MQGGVAGELVSLSASLSLESKTAFMAHERSIFDTWAGGGVVGGVVVKVGWLGRLSGGRLSG